MKPLKLKTIYPDEPCKNFNEWLHWIHVGSKIKYKKIQEKTT